MWRASSSSSFGLDSGSGVEVRSTTVLLYTVRARIHRTTMPVCCDPLIVTTLIPIQGKSKVNANTVEYAVDNSPSNNRDRVLIISERFYSTLALLPHFSDIKRRN